MNRAEAVTSHDGRKSRSSRDGDSFDLETFSELYRHYLPDIYSYLLARTGSQEDASDLAQQVFTNALAALPAYRERGIPIRAWLFQIARHLVIDFHRRHHPASPLDVVPEEVLAVGGDDVEAVILSRESALELGKMVTQLEPSKRDLLALRFAADLKVREIALVLNRTEPSIKSELRRILLNLRENFSND